MFIIKRLYHKQTGLNTNLMGTVNWYQRAVAWEMDPLISDYGYVQGGPFPMQQGSFI